MSFRGAPRGRGTGANSGGFGGGRGGGGFGSRGGTDLILLSQGSFWSSSSHILQDEVDSVEVASRETMDLQLLFLVCNIPIGQFQV
jgi:hypothetical protein